jgi:hypothetical protein
MICSYRLQIAYDYSDWLVNALKSKANYIFYALAVSFYILQEITFYNHFI